MDKVAFPVPGKYLRGPQSADGNLETHMGVDKTTGLRGMEANTDRSKGFPTVVPKPSAPELDPTEACPDGFGAT